MPAIHHTCIHANNTYKRYNRKVDKVHKWRAQWKSKIDIHFKLSSTFPLHHSIILYAHCITVLFTKYLEIYSDVMVSPWMRFWEKNAVSVWDGSVFWPSPKPAQTSAKHFTTHSQMPLDTNSMGRWERCIAERQRTRQTQGAHEWALISSGLGELIPVVKTDQWLTDSDHAAAGCASVSDWHGGAGKHTLLRTSKLQPASVDVHHVGRQTDRQGQKDKQGNQTTYRETQTQVSQ